MADDKVRRPNDHTLHYAVFKGFVLTRIQELCHKLPTLSNIAPSARLREDLGLDGSLRDTVLAQLQKDFAVGEITEDHKERIVTYEDLIDYFFVNFNLNAPALAHLEVQYR